MGDLRDSTPGDLIADKYVLRQLLGEGGMGQVFLARHELTGRAVALKLVPAQNHVTRERLLREARSMGMLAHPNVVGVLDMGEWGDGVYIAMEYLHGVTLREYIARGLLSPAEGIELLLPTCSGVAACHEAGILHRDLKPDNVFVCTNSDGEPLTTVLLDFGVAKILDETLSPSRLTDSGSVVGTPRYMAPEQLGDGQQLDERTDVYALGLILYEALAGRLPYEGPTLRKSVLAILRGDFTPLHVVQPNVPRELSDVVMRALSADVENRQANVAQFATELEPFGDGATWVPPLDVHTMNARGDSWTPPPMPLSGRPESRSAVEAADTVDASPDPSQVATVLAAPPATRRSARAEPSDATQTPNGTERSANDAPSPDAFKRPWLATAAALLVVAATWLVLRNTWAATNTPGSDESAVLAIEAALPGTADGAAAPATAAAAQPSAVHTENAVDRTADAGAREQPEALAEQPEVLTEQPEVLTEQPGTAPETSPEKTSAPVQPAKAHPHKPRPAPRPEEAKAPPPTSPATSATPAPYPPTDNRDPWAE